jgi:hypothetical protein
MFFSPNQSIVRKILFHDTAVSVSKTVILRTYMNNDWMLKQNRLTQVGLRFFFQLIKNCVNRFICSVLLSQIFEFCFNLYFQLFGGSWLRSAIRVFHIVVFILS